MSPWRAVRVDLIALLRLLREPWLWLLVALTVLGGAAAYRVSYPVRLDIGAGPDSRLYDVPYVRSGFNIDPEPDVATTPPGAFRWAFEDARIVFPGLGAGNLAMTLRVAAAQPGPDVAPSGWVLDRTPLSVIPIQPAARTYHVLLPSHTPNLDLQMLTRPFFASGDPRSLAFGADILRIIPLTRSAPAWPVLGWYAGCIAMLYLLLRRSGLEWLPVTGIGLGLVTLLIWGLAVQRLSLTGFAPRLCAVLLAGILLSLPLGPLLAGLAHALGISLPQVEVRAVSSLVMLAWVIRLGGLLHPQSYTSDLGLHMHNLENLVRGEVIFTEDLPARAGGGPAPYPPMSYVMLAPWGLLANSEHTIRIGNTLADSLVIAVCWLLLRAAGAPSLVAYFAAGLYLFATPLLNALSIGEMANVWGQALVSALALMLVRWRLIVTERRSDLVLGAGIAIGLLGHFGVFLSLVIFLGVYAAVLVPRGPWLRFGLIVAGVLVGLFALYYSSFIDIVLQRSGSSVPFSWDRLQGELASAFALRGQIGPLLGLLGLAGLMIWLRQARMRVAAGVVLAPLLTAWLGSTAISLGSLLWTRQALRWEAFVFPALAILGGTALAWLHRQGRLGRSAVYALLLLSCVRGALLWYSQIATYQH